MGTFFKKIMLIFKRISEMMIEFLKSKGGMLTDELLGIAYGVVKQVEQTAGPNDDKFQMAYQMLLEELGEIAIKYSVKVIQTAIQQAVVVLESRGEEIKKTE